MPNSIESILSEAIRLEYSTFTPPLALSGSTLSTSTHSRELNDAERAKLNELIVANKALNDPLDEVHHTVNHFVSVAEVPSPFTLTLEIEWLLKSFVPLNLFFLLLLSFFKIYLLFKR